MSIYPIRSSSLSLKVARGVNAMQAQPSLPSRGATFHDSRLTSGKLSKDYEFSSENSDFYPILCQFISFTQQGSPRGSPETWMRFMFNLPSLREAKIFIDHATSRSRWLDEWLPLLLR